jgi:hypothetical protein
VKAARDEVGDKDWNWRRQRGLKWNKAPWPCNKTINGN